MNVLPEEKRRAMEVALGEGRGDREIERLLGIHRDTVGRWRKRLGFRHSPRDRRLLADFDWLAATCKSSKKRPSARPGRIPSSPWPELWIDEETTLWLGSRREVERQKLLEQRKQEIERILRLADQNASEAARLLGIHPRTLRWQMARLGISARSMPRKSFRHLRGSERYESVLALGLCGHCEHRPPVPGSARCATCIAQSRAYGRRKTLRRIEAGLCVECAKPTDAFRCTDCQARRSSRRSESGLPREPMIREWGTFLNEDLAQERILAELEGRTFDKRGFFKQYAPRQELAIMDRPMSDDGDTLHAVIPSGEPWLAPRSRGNFNQAEERMVRRLDREPTIAELRAEADGRPWQSYVHAVSLEQVEEVIAAWLEFIPRMTPEEYAETNIEAQIETCMPSMSMGEILRCIRESLAWSERDLERRANLTPGVVRQLERGEIGYRATKFQAIALALSAISELEPGRLQAHISAAWGSVAERAVRPVVIESQRDELKRRRTTLKQNLGDLLKRVVSQ